MFFAPWCDHCNALKPEWAAAALKSDEHEHIPFGAVDCTHNGHLCIKVDVPMYPTLKFFDSAEDVKGYFYEGHRSRNSLIEFAWHPARHKNEIAREANLAKESKLRDEL